MNEQKRLVEKMLMVGCAKNGYVSVKAVIKKTGWKKQKVLALGRLLMKERIFSEMVYSHWTRNVKGYSL